MKQLVLAVVTGLTLFAVPATAEAQAWRSINGRQASLDRRIDQGIRSGALTRPEARRIRADYAALDRLEDRYRVGGLSFAERADLNRRFDALSARVRYDKHDRRHYR